MGGRGSGKNDVSRYGNYLGGDGIQKRISFLKEGIEANQHVLDHAELKPTERRSIEIYLENLKAELNELDSKVGLAKQLLGSKGRPMSIEDAVIGANPNFSKGTKEWLENCQRCVIAYELRRRGYNVEATAYEGWDDTARGWKEAFYEMSPVKVGSSDREKVIKNIYKQMEKWGEGSRAIVDLDWSRTKGHVFNAEFKNGKLILMEAQKGNYADWDKYSQHMMPTKTTLWRVDNLEPTEKIVGLIKRKGE